MFFISLGGIQTFEEKLFKNAYPCIIAIDTFSRFWSGFFWAILQGMFACFLRILWWLSCLLVLQLRQRQSGNISPGWKSEHPFLTTSNSLLQVHLLDVNRRVRKVRRPHSSLLQRSGFYHSGIKNEHSTREERKKSIILVALKHHNKETKKHRKRSHIFFKLKKPSFHFLFLERTSMRLIRKG